MEAGEGQPPPLCFNAAIATNQNLISSYNYPTESAILPPSHHQPQLELEPQPVEIDWVSLLNGATAVDPTAAAASSKGEDLQTGGVSCKSSGGGGGGGRCKKTRVPPRVAFHTRSVEDVLDDGYKWRKYGQKAVKNSLHPRSYYRCTYHTCSVKKQIQRLSKDTSIVVTTYEGVHNHPSEKLMETLAPLLKQLHFLGRF